MDTQITTRPLPPSCLPWWRFLLWGCLVLLAMPLQAAAPPRPIKPEALDVRLLVDVSGSMAKADPEHMLAPALQLFIELLPAGSRAGVWTFAQRVNALVKHQPVTALWRTQALIKTATLPAVGLRTALGAAIDQAAWDWQAPAADRQRHLILLTDGEVDLSDSNAVNEQARNDLLRTRLPQLAAAGFRVHTMALSAQGDVAFLQEAASLSGGQFLSPSKPEALPEVLLQLFAAIGPADRIPVSTERLELTGVARPDADSVGALPNPTAGVFQVEPDLSEITVFVVKDSGQPLQVLAPDGTTYDRARIPVGARWHVSAGYELLTLKNPVPGTWQTQGGRAQVYSYGSLQLRLLDRPLRIAPGTAHALRFTLESGNPAEPLSPDFFRLVQFTASVAADRGQPLAAVERSPDGQLQVLLSGLGGVEQGQLRLSAEGPTFERLIEYAFTVAHPVRVELHPGLDDAVAPVLWVTLQQPGLEPGSARVAVGVRQSPAPQRWYPLAAQAAGMWRVELPAELQGAVELELDVHANYLNGGEFNYRTDRLIATLPVTAAERFSFADNGRQDAPARLATAVVSTSGLQSKPTPATDVAPEQPADSEPGQAAGEPEAAPALTAAEALAAQQEIAPEEPAQVPVWFGGVGMLLPLLLALGLAWALSRVTIMRPEPIEEPLPDAA